MIDAALKYAAAGIPVFPCKLDKTPHTEHGFKDATCNESKIRAWWTRWPRASIGMPTGCVSGRFVIDVDPRHDGDKSLEELQTKHGPLPRTLEVKTGSGGCHLHFQCRGAKIRNSAGKLGKGLDVRGGGGYVILPPSQHESGNCYQWIDESQPLLDIPQWLVRLIIERRPRMASTNGDSNGPRIPEGKRNDHLASLAGGLRREGFCEEDILEVLLRKNENNCDPPLPDSEVREIATSISRYEPAEPLLHGRVPITELSNAQRFLTKYATDVRYLADRAVWVCWNGTHWAVNDLGGVRRKMEGSCRGIYVEASTSANETSRKELATWAKKSETRHIQENSLVMAQHDLRVEVRSFSDLFDRQPLLLNVKNGTIHLKAGELHPHRREDFLTKVVPIEYDPKATCPKFSRFMSETFGQANMIGYLSRFAGYCLTGLTSAQSWFMFHGVTASGKSTLLTVLRGILGPYALALPENYFLATTNNADYVTATLAGVRLATCSETNEGRMLDVAKIKALTGEDALSAALKYQNHFQFRPEVKLVLATNHAPRIPATDDSIWRRVKVVPFNVTVPEEKRIAGLAEMLVKEEGPGILRWAVLGYQAFWLDGLGEPDAVKDAVASYRSAEDVVGNFTLECCARDSESKTPRREIYKCYSEWAVDNGLRPMSAKRFATELQRLGIRGDPGDRFWLGVRLVDDAVI